MTILVFELFSDVDFALAFIRSIIEHDTNGKVLYINIVSIPKI